MKIFSKATFILSLCAVSSLAYADAILPSEVFAEMSRDSSKETVFFWEGKEYTCDTPISINFDEKDAKELCGLCKNRKLRKRKKDYYGRSTTSFACVPKSIKKCPEDKPLLDKFGFCHSCDDPKGIDIYNEKDCSLCKNRKIDHPWSLNTGCILKLCPEDKPVLNWYNSSCHSCDEPENIFLGYGDPLPEPAPTEESVDYCSPEAVKKPLPWRIRSAFDGVSTLKDRNKEGKLPDCPNRTVHVARFERWSAYHSSLTTCPPDKPLENHSGSCYSCDEKNPIFLDDAFVFAGKVQCGKLYDEDLKLMGSVKGATLSKKASELSNEEIYNKVFDVYDEQGKKVAYIKIKKDYDENSEYSFGRESSLDNYKESRRKAEIPGSWESRREYNNFEIEALLYDSNDKRIAKGNVKIYEDVSKNKNFLDGDYYFFEGVHPDKICPNREIGKYKNFSGMASMLKGEK